MSAIIHTNFSLLEGAATIPALLDCAAQQGHHTVAIADTNGLYGAMFFYREALARGLRPVLGATVDAPDGSAIVLARNLAGYSALCRLVTQRHVDPAFRLGDALAAACTERHDHLSVFSASSAVLQALAPWPEADVAVALEGIDTPAGRRAQVHAHNLTLRYRRPPAAVPPVYFAVSEQYAIHRVLTAIRRLKSIAVLLPEETAPQESYLHTPQEITARFAHQPQALAQTERILDQCNLVLDSGRLHFPDFPVPRGETAGSYLRALATAGAVERYGALRPDVTARLEQELTTIDTLGYAGYFLIVWDIVRWALERHIPCLGRGSAAGSLVAYCLRLTNVDPLHHNLYFERFLNPQRSDPPDIDIDLCWRRRQDVLEYVYQRYGDDRVAMLCIYSTLGARSSFRDVAKAFGVDEEEIDRIARRLPHGSLTRALQQTRPEMRSLPLHEEPWRSILAVGQAIDGFPRHLSTHAGGLVVAPGPLTDLVPLQPAAGGLRITQYDMHAIKELGLLKIDLLGQRSLSVVADTVRTLRGSKPHTSSQMPPDGAAQLDRLPYNDPETLALINRGQTMGCFQLESPGMRQLLQKMNIRDQETLIAAISVIRPGPADAGMMAHYVARHNGEEEIHHLHPRLASVLRETYGILLYQEDTLRVVQAVAGMNLAEADLLRRAMTKDRSPQTMETLRERFLTGAASEGIAPQIAEEVWRRVSHFAGYAFCKAHSAAYARLSYETAYLKAHYPAAFMAAVLANGGGFYHTSAYIEECRRMGLRILSPDINRSGANFTSEGAAIRIGLGVIRNMSTRTLVQILRERHANGPFVSFGDVRRRVEIGKSELRTLIRAGVFDTFEIARPELLWRLQAEEETPRRPGPAGQADLFDLGEEPSAWCRVVPRVQEYSLREKLLIELELFGFAVQAHPLVLFSRELRSLNTISADHLATHVGHCVRIAGRPVASKSTTTRHGDAMRFVTLDDPTGIFEVTLFPRAYQQYGWVLATDGPYLVEGKVEADRGAITITASRLSLIRSDHTGLSQLAS